MAEDSAGHKASERGAPVCATLLTGKCRVKPGQLILGARSVMRSIRWTSWGGNKAVGFGPFENVGGAGDPDGDIGPVKARAKFTQIETCGGRARYQRLTVKYGSGFNQTWRTGPYNSCDIISRQLHKGSECGSFELDGLIKPVRVKISKGHFSCRIARRVMKDLYHGGDTGNWSCIGPQTGYAKCKKANRGTIVARI